MGNEHSVRATHFQRPDDSPNALKEEPEDHHISISNKMVERLVEDAALSGRVDSGLSNPRGDYREKIFIEKLKSLDDNHTERCGLTIGELNAMLKRVDMRTANMISVEPVCADIRQKIIECYDTTSPPSEIFKCWDTISAFTECVQEAGAKRLRARRERDALETERRSRHVAHAREHALKDLR